MVMSMAEKNRMRAECSVKPRIYGGGVAQDKIKASPRALRLRERFFRWPYVICLERMRAYTESFKETENEPMAIRRAKALKRYFETKTITLQEDELLVGNVAGQPRAGVLYIDIGRKWVEDDIDTLPTRPYDPFEVSEEQVREIKEEYLPYWKGKTVDEAIVAAMPDETRRQAAGGGIVDNDIIRSFGIGHFDPNMKLVLSKGFGGIRKESKDKLEGLDLTIPENLEKADFLRSVIIVCDGMEIFARRHADMARELAARERNELRKKELLQIADVCDHVPMNPARSFREALQTILFVQVGIQCEMNGVSISPPRFDQCVHPFYKKDVEGGRLTKEQAQELIDLLWIKLSEITWLMTNTYSKFSAGYLAYQNVAVGGVDIHGKDATNDVTYMAIQGTMNIRLTQPSLSIRVHPQTPMELLEKVAELVSLGTGQPAIYNDDVAISILLQLGYSLDEARDWSVGGCVEPNGSGNDYTWSNGGQFNLAAAFECAINNGILRKTGLQMGLSTGDPRKWASIEQVKEAFRKQVEYFVRHLVIADLIAMQKHRDLLPVPLESTLIEGCLESSKDASWGGAKHTSGPGLLTTGVADVTNSLVAIKHLIFNRKMLTWDQLLNVLENDFEDSEDVRKLCLSAPKYGNDADDRDINEMLAFVGETVSGTIQKYRNIWGTPFTSGLIPVSSNTPHGMLVGAAPHGRKAWAPLAEGCSPTQGSDINGPTTAVRAVAKLNHAEHWDGTQYNLKFSPGLFNTQAGIRQLANLVRTYFDLGGYHVQINVVSADVLRAAQEHPEEYLDLMVRVAGYSAYFVDLTWEIQDDIISRTEHAF